MNAVEIEQAITDLAEQPYDPAEFPYAFLEAFGNKATTIKRLRAGASNKSDLGGVLQTSNIHILTCDAGRVTQTLAALKASPATAKAKAKFILATDGADFEAEDLTSGDTVACAFKDFPDHFGFFLPLAGISTVRQISENAFDIRATSRLNRLYVELLKDNPEWGTAERRHDMNKLMARLIFCFFAEDTDIFVGKGRFTETVAQMSARDSSNTHEVLATLFRAMNTKREDRAAAKVPRWAEDFPYVNGQLFSGSEEVPRFSKIARSYLLHVGGLDWTKINPDIFGSMIQAVAEDEERGELGMHYTSVPNILKVLNPLFLDDLRAKLEEAGANPRTLLNLRKRIAKIRVFDPACGSGNFLVIAYKEMRAIEAEINRRRGEPDRASEIPVTNFRGIELRDFPAEIARLALVIAEYQCDVLYRGQKLALAEFLPLRNENWITCGNALRLDWLSICPPTGTGVKVQADDLFGSPLDQAEIDFENEGGETYICGNPPYLGSRWQTDEHKADLGAIFGGRVQKWKSLDYVAGWFLKAADYGSHTSAVTALVATNSVCQGQQVPILWPEIFKTGHEICFAYTSFKWSNLAAHNAGVTVVIVGISNRAGKSRRLFSTGDDGVTTLREAEHINAYLIAGPNVIVEGASRPADSLATMQFGNHPYYGASLIFSKSDAHQMRSADPRAARFIRPLYGSQEFISAVPRACLWIEDHEAEEARGIPLIADRMSAVASARRGKKQDKAAQKLAETPYRFRDQQTAKNHILVVPRVSSETVAASAVEAIDIDHLAAELAGVADADDITVLRHVRTSADKRAAEEIADRKPCEDFETFRPLFQRVQAEVKTGMRQSQPIEAGRRAIEVGDFFVLDGLTLYVAEVGEPLKTTAGEVDRRLRLIFSNGTESNLLLRSLQRAFYNDPAARRLASPESGQLSFGGELEADDVESGTIYVLRSLSDHPYVAQHRGIIHKMGVTGGRVEARIANAEHDSTYLLAKVEVVATYKLAGINRTRMENLFHRLFAPARLNITINDRFGHPVQPEEWFLVPLFVIDEAVARIKDGSITGYIYDPKAAKLVKAQDGSNAI